MCHTIRQGWGMVFWLTRNFDQYSVEISSFSSNFGGSFFSSVFSILVSSVSLFPLLFLFCCYTYPRIVFYFRDFIFQFQNSFLLHSFYIFTEISSISFITTMFFFISLSIILIAIIKSLPVLKLNIKYRLDLKIPQADKTL